MHLETIDRNMLQLSKKLAFLKEFSFHLAGGTGLAYKKYGRNVNFFHLLKGLTYFEDAEKNPEPMMLDKKTSWKEIKKFFISHAKDFERSFQDIAVRQH